jgi:hypothetical protein
VKQIFPGECSEGITDGIIKNNNKKYLIGDSLGKNAV